MCRKKMGGRGKEAAGPRGTGRKPLLLSLDALGRLRQSVRGGGGGGGGGGSFSLSKASDHMRMGEGGKESLPPFPPTVRSARGEGRRGGGRMDHSVPDGKKEVEEEEDRGGLIYFSPGLSTSSVPSPSPPFSPSPPGRFFHGGAQRTISSGPEQRKKTRTRRRRRRRKETLSFPFSERGATTSFSHTASTIPLLSLFSPFPFFFSSTLAVSYGDHLHVLGLRRRGTRGGGPPPISIHPGIPPLPLGC